MYRHTQIQHIKSSGSCAAPLLYSTILSLKWFVIQEKETFRLWSVIPPLCPLLVVLQGIVFLRSPLLCTCTIHEQNNQQSYRKHVYLNQETEMCNYLATSGKYTCVLVGSHSCHIGAWVPKYLMPKKAAPITMPRFPDWFLLIAIGESGNFQCQNFWQPLALL